MSDLAQVVRFHRIGGIEVLQVDQVDSAPPGPDEVVIEVDAFALNRADLMFIEGAHYTLPILPSRIGSEAVGRITALGSAVSGFQLGDRVSSLPFHTQNHGVHGTVATVPARYIRRTPPGLSDVQACSIWMQFLTSYFALTRVCAIAPRDTVLITAAASSAGLGAIAIAKRLGANVIGTVRSREKITAVRQAGADHALAVSEVDDLAALLAPLVGKAGIRVAFDPIGGDSLARYVDCLSLGSVVIGYGALSGRNPVIPVAAMVRQQSIFWPYSMFNHVTIAEQLSDATAFVEACVADGSLVPAIDRVFAFSQVLDAYAYMVGNSQAGKIVVQVRGV